MDIPAKENLINDTNKKIIREKEFEMILQNKKVCFNYLMHSMGKETAYLLILLTNGELQGY